MGEVQVTINFLNTWIDVSEHNIQVLAKPEDPMGTFYVRKLEQHVQVSEDPPPWKQD